MKDLLEDVERQVTSYLFVSISKVCVLGHFPNRECSPDVVELMTNWQRERRMNRGNIAWNKDDFLAEVRARWLDVEEGECGTGTEAVHHHHTLPIQVILSTLADFREYPVGSDTHCPVIQVSELSCNTDVSYAPIPASRGEVVRRADMELLLGFRGNAANSLYECSSVRVYSSLSMVAGE